MSVISALANRYPEVLARLARVCSPHERSDMRGPACGKAPDIAEPVIGPRFARARWLIRATIAVARSNLPAQLAVERIRTAPAQRHGKYHQSPQESKLRARS